MKVRMQDEDEDTTSNPVPRNDVPIVACTPESQSTLVDPKLKADLECLSIIKFVIAAEKKESSANLLPFLVQVENILTKEQQRCKAQKMKF